MRIVILFVAIALIVGCLIGCKPKQEAQPVGPPPGGCKIKAAPPIEKVEKAAEEPKAEVEVCVVCGMDVDPTSPDTVKVKHEGKEYKVCAKKCADEFKADPAKYIIEEEAAAKGGEPEKKAMAPAKEGLEPAAKAEPPAKKGPPPVKGKTP